MDEVSIERGRMRCVDTQPFFGGVDRIRSRGRGEVVDDSGHIGERSRLATGYCEYLGDESERSPVKRADEAREREDFRKTS